MLLSAAEVTVEDESNGAYTVRYTVPQDSVDDIFTIAVRMAVRASSQSQPPSSTSL